MHRLRVLLPHGLRGREGDGLSEPELSEYHELSTLCFCGHSCGAHARGDAKSPSHYRNGSVWACFSDGCKCQMFETEAGKRMPEVFIGIEIGQKP